MPKQAKSNWRSRHQVRRRCLPLGSVRSDQSEVGLCPCRPHLWLRPNRKDPRTALPLPREDGTLAANAVAP